MAQVETRVTVEKAYKALIPDVNNHELKLVSNAIVLGLQPWSKNDACEYHSRALLAARIDGHEKITSDFISNWDSNESNLLL